MRVTVKIDVKLYACLEMCARYPVFAHFNIICGPLVYFSSFRFFFLDFLVILFILYCLLCFSCSDL